LEYAGKTAINKAAKKHGYGTVFNINEKKDNK